MHVWLTGAKHTNAFPNKPCFYGSAVQFFFKNTVGKGEIALKEQFLLFPTVFSILLENLQPFSSSSKLSCANSFSLEMSKFVVWETVDEIFMTTDCKVILSVARI